MKLEELVDLSVGILLLPVFLSRELLLLLSVSQLTRLTSMMVLVLVKLLLESALTSGDESTTTLGQSTYSTT